MHNSKARLAALKLRQSSYSRSKEGLAWQHARISQVRCRRRPVVGIAVHLKTKYLGISFSPDADRFSVGLGILWGNSSVMSCRCPGWFPLSVPSPLFSGEVPSSVRDISQLINFHLRRITTTLTTSVREWVRKQIRSRGFRGSRGRH